MTTPAEIDALLALPYERCPTCRSNWQFFPPAKIDGTDAFRCIECKAVYPVLNARAIKAEAALEPFAEVAAHDIGTDESDEDLFRPISRGNNRAPLLTVGDFRRAAAQASAMKEGE